jgi:hypothetical protein
VEVVRLPVSIFLESGDKGQDDIDGKDDIKDDLHSSLIPRVDYIIFITFITVEFRKNETDMNRVDDIAPEHAEERDSFPGAVPATGRWLDDDVETWHFHLLVVFKKL